MKKFLAFLTLLFVMSFAACGDDDNENDKDNPYTPGFWNIGDTGPGGGTVFFSEGSQYKECSGELGTYDWNDAKAIAGNHRGGGVANWRLPDRGELDLMYENLHRQGLGGFSIDHYWSSTIDSANYPLRKSFFNGFWSRGSSNSNHRVRAVRSFRGDPVNPGDTTSLTIKNESGFEITDVLWNNVPFVNDQLENSIKPGTSVTMTVQAGMGFIRFKPKLNPINARTSELVIVEINEPREFIFLNNTIVVNESNENTGTLVSFSGVPQIIVRQGNTVIAQHQEYSFETVRTGTTREVTFTIANTGEANLILETVNGNRINLIDNTSGFYSVNLQPISSTIVPGSNTTFTIRFNPTTVGNNFAAIVQIETNSHTNDEFAFRVIGHSDDKNYQIGDTGPGGGIIFLAESGQYKEVSGDLGPHTWGNARTIASNFRGGGFVNWRLPDRGELGLMYSNLHLNDLGGFADNYYWSSVSNSFSFDQAWCKDFSTGLEHSYLQSWNTPIVRAVRSFVIH
jgi:hypothetical protein